jgi:hypothetical protein
VVTASVTLMLGGAEVLVSAFLLGLIDGRPGEKDLANEHG